MRIYDAKITYQLVSLGEEVILTRPEPAIAYMRSLFEESPYQELFCILLLDRKGHPIARVKCTVGTVSACLVDAREVFKAAILASASSLMCFHNHPSGDPSPSPADTQITRKLREAGNIIEIPVDDHIIIGDKHTDPCGRGYYSFREAGVI